MDIIRIIMTSHMTLSAVPYLGGTLEYSLSTLWTLNLGLMFIYPFSVIDIYNKVGPDTLLAGYWISGRFIMPDIWLWRIFKMA